VDGADASCSHVGLRRSMAKTSQTWPIEMEATVINRTFGTGARHDA
jgi:hypothetical protein